MDDGNTIATSDRIIVPVMDFQPLGPCLAGGVKDMSDDKLLDRCVVVAFVLSVLAVTAGWLGLEFVGRLLRGAAS
jgi:hypothetical protein